MEKNKKVNKEKVDILKEVVQRNKLRNKGESIDTMVAFLQAKGIEARYCPQMSRRIEG